MNEKDKKYKPYKIPGQMTLFENNEKIQLGLSKKLTDSPKKVEEKTFAEIEVSGNVETSSIEYAPRTQVIDFVVDEKRKIFNEMRQIARDSYSTNVYQSKFYNKNTQEYNSKVFYKQAMFMKDFEDDYEGRASFSAYFPYYQMMGYEQLRTYFTWRTNIRKGKIYDIHLAYAFVYIYELLNNVGADNPQDGLDKLMSFWIDFRECNPTIDKYILKWIKDYHIYYELPKSFKEFVFENEIYMHYPKMFLYESDINDNFELFCSISKYNIKQSAFYNNETSELIINCFYYVMNKLKHLFEAENIDIYDIIFQPNKKLSAWTPFKGALFYPWIRGKDRKVVLSDNEIYLFSLNKWSYSTTLTTDKGKQLVSYIMKLMESELRKVMCYKHKLSINMDVKNNILIQKLNKTQLSIEEIISKAVLEYYKEINKTVVSVSENVLSQIRQEAFDTQEKLIVPEDDNIVYQVNEQFELPINIVSENIQSEKPLQQAETQILDGWTSLKNILSETEVKTLLLALQKGNIKQFADENGIMLEVLADSINEKAVDCIGDNILEMDDEMIIYDEYIENVMKVVEE